MTLRRTALAAIGVVALAVPTVAAAHFGRDNHPSRDNHPGQGSAHGQGQSHAVMYIFKGTYDGGGLVNVTHGNAHARRAGLVGAGDVAFDLTNSKLSVADTNADTLVDANDIVNGDAVLVQARLPKGDPGTQPFAARHLVDQTNPAADDGADDTADGTDDTADGDQ
jgi:hypothetical protein